MLYGLRKFQFTLPKLSSIQEKLSTIEFNCNYNLLNFCQLCLNISTCSLSGPELHFVDAQVSGFQLQLEHQNDLLFSEHKNSHSHEYDHQMLLKRSI